MASDSDDSNSPPAAPGLGAVAAAAAQVRRGPAPVESWNPPFCGDIGLEIRTDGSWWYQGTVIGRRALVELFASVLRKDDDGATYLVTPFEKVLVAVADAPFLGVELAVEGRADAQTIRIRTNLDEWVSIGPDHPIRFETESGTGGLKPYVRVRGRLDARLTRQATRELFALALEGSDDAGRDGEAAVYSGGRRWVIGMK